MKKNQSCLIIAGELSGEEHAMSFFPELKKLSPDIEFYGVGGNSLENQGMSLCYHLKNFSSFGIIEVLKKIPFYIKAKKYLLNEVDKKNTQVAILIDFQDFNLNLAKSLHERGVKVLYYVAPQAWAWRENRAHVLKKVVHSLFVILPFEKEWFKNKGLHQIIKLQHPLIKKFSSSFDNIPNRIKAKNQSIFKLLILPGSRKSEVNKLLPFYLEALDRYQKIRSIKFSLHLVLASSLPTSIIDPYRHLLDKVSSEDQMIEELCRADFAIATSGTVTLSCALFEVPAIVCYKVNQLSAVFFRHYFQYNGFISLPNLILKKMIYPELIQENFDFYYFCFYLDMFVLNLDKYNETIWELRKLKGLLEQDEVNVPKYMANIINQ